MFSYDELSQRDRAAGRVTLVLAKSGILELGDNRPTLRTSDIIGFSSTTVT